MATFHGDLSRSPEGSAMAELDKRLDEVARTYAGRPPAEVLDALEAAVRGMGLQPDVAGLTERARRISETR